MRPPISELSPTAFETVQDHLKDEFSDGNGFQVPVSNKQEIPGDMLNIMPGDTDNSITFDIREAESGRPVVIFQAIREGNSTSVLPLSGDVALLPQIVRSAFTKTGLNREVLNADQRQNLSFYEPSGKARSKPIPPKPIAA